MRDMLVVGMPPRSGGASPLAAEREEKKLQLHRLNNEADGTNDLDLSSSVGDIFT